MKISWTIHNKNINNNNNKTDQEKEETTTFFENNNNSSCFFCVNVAVPGKIVNSETAPRDVELNASNISKPKILSIHDADDSIAHSSLLPFCVNNNNKKSNSNNNQNMMENNNNNNNLLVPKITWRVRTPFPDQVPQELQQILEQHGRSK